MGNRKNQPEPIPDNIEYLGEENGIHRWVGNPVKQPRKVRKDKYAPVKIANMKAKRVSAGHSHTILIDLEGSV